jgi:hypothetical protein
MKIIAALHTNVQAPASSQGFRCPGSQHWQIFDVPSHFDLSERSVSAFVAFRTVPTATSSLSASCSAVTWARPVRGSICRRISAPTMHVLELRRASRPSCSTRFMGHPSKIQAKAACKRPCRGSPALLALPTSRAEISLARQGALELLSARVRTSDGWPALDDSGRSRSGYCGSRTVRSRSLRSVAPVDRQLILLSAF